MAAEPEETAPPRPALLHLSHPRRCSQPSCRCRDIIAQAARLERFGHHPLHGLLRRRTLAHVTRHLFVCQCVPHSIGAHDDCAAHDCAALLARDAPRRRRGAAQGRSGCDGADGGDGGDRPAAIGIADSAANRHAPRKAPQRAAWPSAGAGGLAQLEAGRLHACPLLRAIAQPVLLGEERGRSRGCHPLDQQCGRVPGVRHCQLGAGYVPHGDRERRSRCVGERDRASVQSLEGALACRLQRRGSRVPPGGDLLLEEGQGLIETQLGYLRAAVAVGHQH
mmetsp:Transcript_5898/g.11654  ORF Transcript_5898/g.11654 Transcript_5898/m.11654 type:complete len:279 (+) Transcript_5898:469-1305(+)